MVINIGVLKGKISSVVQDNTGLLDQSVGGDIDNAISDALETYDDDAPRYVVADLVGDGLAYDFALPASYTDGYSRLVSIEYPIGSRYAQYLPATDWSIYRVPSTLSIAVTTTIPGTGIANEVQTITVVGAPPAGTFTLTYVGQTTPAIAYSASAATVEAALKALSNIGAGDVTCAGGPLPDTPLAVEFTGTLALTDVAQMTVDGSNLMDVTGYRLRLYSTTPAAATSFRLLYTGRHTISGFEGAIATTIIGYHTEAFVSLCGAKCLYRLAARYTQEAEVTLGLDSVDRVNKADATRRLADRLLASYREIVGVSRGESPASAVLQWRSGLGGGPVSLLTHRG